MSSAGLEPPSVGEFGFDQADLAGDVCETRSISREGEASCADVTPELVYRSVEEFVTELLLPTYRRKVDGRTATWCPDWPAHPEAVVRLEALWRSWEHLRLEPSLGMSVWLRDHLDHHLPILLAVHGPFRGCSPGRGHKPTDAQSLREPRDTPLESN